MVATIAVQISEVARLPGLFERLVKCWDNLYALVANVDYPNRKQLVKAVDQLEENQRSMEKNIEKFVNLNIQFIVLCADPAKLEDAELEMMVHLAAFEDSFFRNIVKSLELNTKVMEELNSKRMMMLVGSDVTFRIQELSENTGKNSNCLIDQSWHWRDEMLTMKLLLELGKRRPLTTEEKILLTDASVIYTPVVQDPSDSRADWYGDDGR